MGLPVIRSPLAPPGGAKPRFSMAALGCERCIDFVCVFCGYAPCVLVSFRGELFAVFVSGFRVGCGWAFGLGVEELTEPPIF